MKECRYEGCGRKVKARGLCSTHYRLHLDGEPLRPLRRYKERYPAPAPGKKICTRCERVKDVERDFYKRRDGSPQSNCRDCCIELAQDRYWRRKEAEIFGNGQTDTQVHQ